MDWRTLRSINFSANYISFTSTLTSTHIDYDTLLFCFSPLVYFYSTDTRHWGTERAEKGDREGIPYIHPIP